MSANAWKSFSLWPDDVLFFRDGKPSTVGEDHYLRSLFPPHPTTLYGAVRTRRLLDEGVNLAGIHRANWPNRVGDLADEVGAWGNFGSLELRGPWLVRKDGNGATEALLPAPQDLGLVTARPATAASEDAPREDQLPEIRERVRYRCLARPQGDSPDRGWSHPLGNWSPYSRENGTWTIYKPKKEGDQPEPAAGWYLTPAGIERWAKGDLPEVEHFVHAGALWVDEPRTSVGLESEAETKGKPELRRHATGKLFTFGFIRLRPGVGLGFEARGTGLKTGGGLRLGGEGRMVRLESGPAFPTGGATPPPGKPLCLAFATPALSKQGAYPPGTMPPGAPEEAAWRQEERSCTLDGKKHRLLGGILKNAQLFGGWDLARNRAKPLRRAIAPGSLYLLRPPDGASAAGHLHGSHLTDYDTPNERLARQGSGLALTGRYPWEDD